MITQALFTFLLSTDFLNIYPICKGVILQIRNNQAVKQKSALLKRQDKRQPIHIVRHFIKNTEPKFNGKVILK